MNSLYLMSASDVLLSVSKILFQTLCVFSQIKDIKHIEQNFILLPGPCPKGVTLGCSGGLKF